MTGQSAIERLRWWYSILPKALKGLLTVNVAIYLLWLVFLLPPLQGIRGLLEANLVLYPDFVAVLYKPWTLITYGFLHIRPGVWGLISIGINMLWLYWMGREYEEVYGSHKLFGLYIWSILFGGLFALAISPFFTASLPVYGGLPAVLGVLAAMATLNPERRIPFILIGMVSLKGLTIGLIVILALLHFGHWAYVMAFLGSAIGGYVFVRAQQSGRDLAAWCRWIFEPKSSRKRTVETVESVGYVDDSPRRRRAAVIDQLLDKINEQGYDALTDEEKRTLHDASRPD